MERRDYIEKQKKFECNNCPAINCINKNKNQKCKGYCTGEYFGKKTDPFLFDRITIQEGIFCKELLEEKQMVKKEKCTSEEWNHCRVEKMGCSGCYYNENKNENKLEEAKQWLNDFTNIIAINKQYTITEGRLTKVQESIKTVLKGYEKLQKRNNRQYKLLQKKDKQLENSNNERDEYKGYYESTYKRFRHLIESKFIEKYDQYDFKKRRLQVRYKRS